MVPLHHRGGTFTPSPAQSIVTATSQSPHNTQHGGLSAGPSPSTPTGSSTAKIAVAQIYLLLSTIKEDKDHTKFNLQSEQLQKLIDDHGMEAFQKYFSRMVRDSSPQIFPSLNRPSTNPGNYSLLVKEIRLISQDVHKAGQIAESIETANDDLFRDFDLSTFMEHFKMDALEKTILALAFKTGSRPDLKTKADAILSANYAMFLQILSRPNLNIHPGLSPSFVATIVDRFIQEYPPNFNEQARSDLVMAIRLRYSGMEQEIPPTEVLAASYLLKIIFDPNPFISYIRRVGSAFTADEASCTKYIHSAPIARLDEEQVSASLIYTAISRTPPFSTSVLVKCLRNEVPPTLSWQQVVRYFDQPNLRVTQEQFLSLYRALSPLAESDEAPNSLDIQSLWGGPWQNSETQISFVSAYASLSSDQIDASTVPGIQPSFTLDEYANSPEDIRERAALAVKHPLVSTAALDGVFHAALQSEAASQTPEAKRFFKQVVIPNLDIFLVSAFGVPKPWPEFANDTMKSLFERFLHKVDPAYDFVLSSLWLKDRNWVVQRLIEAHANNPLDLPLILEHALKHEWLYDLLILNGFGLDLAALAHAKDALDLEKWQQKHSQHPTELAQMLLTFLNIKAQHEMQFQRGEQGQLLSTMLPVKTVSVLLDILGSILPRSQRGDLMIVQRTCITNYPRLINYGEGFDDIIDANGSEKNSLPQESIDKMEEHYKLMYSDDVKVRAVVEALLGYKHSRDPADQDVFACMIHGLFDEYSLYSTYPLEALKTTAVLFGGIIKAKLLSNLPLEVALGMILDAVKDNSSDQPMYKFGLEALKQTLERFDEWPGFCIQLVQIPGLQGTDVWDKAEEVSRDQDRHSNGSGNGAQNEAVNGTANGSFGEAPQADPGRPPFSSINVELSSYNGIYEEPSGETQEKVQFALNNITEINLVSKFEELKDIVEEKHQQWFASHLVGERAKTQPNYHPLYLGLVKLFDAKSLWAELLRETYVHVIRMLNAEITVQSPTERNHLKNLAGWLGSLTLARDKPIKHINVAFKPLLLEAYDTNRLVIVIPFVCKVLLQGATSTIFKPPNPWLMDIIFLLIELYHRGDLKLNLKFEIEVLCKGLSLDYKIIEPSTDIQTRLPPLDEATDNAISDTVDRYDAISLTGIGAGVGNERFSAQEIISTIPDLGPLLIYPPMNDMVNQGRLQEIARVAITRAVQEIISPVVERSVTIAAIATAQMIQKDFATEPDENRLRSSAIQMVKRMAGSLALVTSKEPLRASMSNYIRAGSAELPQGLPEGTILMCVNSNLEMACSQVEKKAEERAVPEIDEMIEVEIDARRRHRAARPNDPYIDSRLSRWALTIPNPFKLMPGAPGGLNPEQMAIYEEFGRQPRLPAPGILSHGPSSSDATRLTANDILHDQYPVIPNLPDTSDTPAMPHVTAQQHPYSQATAPLSNGRNQAPPVDNRGLADRISELLENLLRTANNTPDQHFMDLPRSHAIIDIIDALMTLIIRNSQASDEASRYTADQICHMIFTPIEDDLAIESLTHVLQALCSMSIGTTRQVTMFIAHQPDERLLNVPLVIALMRVETPLLEWHRIDTATAKALQQQKLSALDFLTVLVSRVLLVDQPMALNTDFARSFEAVNQWLSDEPDLEPGRQLIHLLKSPGRMYPGGRESDDIQARRDQMEYVFEEWVNLCSSTKATDRTLSMFLDQLYNNQLVNDEDSQCLFLRICLEISVDHVEQNLQSNMNAQDSYLNIDALATLISHLVKQRGERIGEAKGNKAEYLEAILWLIVLMLNQHHVMRGERFNPKVFFRLLSTMLGEFSSSANQLSAQDRDDILLVFAAAFLRLRPSVFPGFTHSWMALISHEKFLPLLLRVPGQGGWDPLFKLVQALLAYLGELLKPLNVVIVAKDIYRGALKLLVVLYHDSPEFLAGNHIRLCAAIPPHCIHLQNIILTASSSAFTLLPDPLQPGLKIDRIEEIRDLPNISGDVEAPLQQAGLLDLIELALQNGPAEDAVAQVAHAIQRKNGHETSAGYRPINVDTILIDSIVLHVSSHSITKALQKGGPTFIQASPDSALLSMLVHELGPEARYYFLSSMTNQLRYPNAHTHYFSQELLEIFGSDINDQEQSDIRQQITRIFLERIVGSWPHPWGLIVTIIELAKNDKYNFFDLPFVKSAPDVRDRFAILLRPT